MAQDVGVSAEMLESNQELQDAVLTAYHAVTILFEKSPAFKIMCNDLGKVWVKNSSV